VETLYDTRLEMSVNCNSHERVYILTYYCVQRHDKLNKMSGNMLSIME
jgi:hypothetical protein